VQQNVVGFVAAAVPVGVDADGAHDPGSSVVAAFSLKDLAVGSDPHFPGTKKTPVGVMHEVSR
jgi:hypothetical protein